MEASEYQKIVNKTAVYPEHMGHAYCMLGLDGEFNEFIEALNYEDEDRHIKECGDTWWYLCALSRKEFNIEFETISNAFYDRMDGNNNIKSPGRTEDPYPTTHVRYFYKSKGELSEIVKKMYRDRKTPDIKKVFDLLSNLGYHLRCIMRYYNLDFNNVLEVNYNKLIKRRETNTIHGEGDNREEFVK